MPKQPNQIIGAFIIRNEGDGCLTSKYHHGDSSECPFTETCKRTTPLINDDVFIGTYRTVWLEDNNIHILAELTIQRHRKNSAIFQLFWRDVKNNGDIFEGTGMIVDDLLAGAYWD